MSELLVPKYKFLILIHQLLVSSSQFLIHITSVTCSAFITHTHQLGSILRLHWNSLSLLKEGDLVTYALISKENNFLFEILYSLALLVAYLSNTQLQEDL